MAVSYIYFAYYTCSFIIEVLYLVRGKEKEKHALHVLVAIFFSIADFYFSWL